MALVILSCGGCVSGRPLAQLHVPAPAFDPVAFFVGPTQGRAMLKIVTRGPILVAVEGRGRVTADGTLILDQSVRMGAAAPKQRSWRLHPDGPGRWTGTLSDAAGPVRGDIAGNCLHLAFPMQGGLKAQQWLYMAAGSTVVRNVMVVRKLGVPVARLDETITHLAQ